MRFREVSINNLQDNVHDCQESIYNRPMALYDAEAFGRWLEEQFRNSKYKSHSELADVAGLKRSTVSALIGAKPQTATNKPSQPRAETVIKIAKALGVDLNEALLLAGHAPLTQSETKKPSNLPELLAALDGLGIAVDWATIKNNFENYTPDDFEELKEQIAANVGIKIKRVTSR